MTIRRATTALGTFYHVAEDFYIAGVLDCGVAWERGVLEVVRHLLPARGPCNVVDVGAHIGTHAVPYARWVRGRGRVYAFEPQPVMVALLRRNLETNGCVADVEIFQSAAGHQDGLEVSMENVIRDGPNAGVAFAYEDGTDFNYGGLQLGPGGVRVRMRTLDSFHFDNVGLLKIDAEGAETLVLWGARELIRSWRPIILFERNEKYITDSMHEMMPIPDEVLAFRIEGYAASLGYLPPVDVGSGQFLLHPTPSIRRINL
jgi:FkbM family methyltransferase